MRLGRKDWRKRRLKVLQAVFLAALVFCWAGQALAQKKDGDGKKDFGGPSLVEVAPVREVSTPPTYEASGLALPVQRSIISSDVSARIRTIHGRLGDQVKTGAVLAEMENPSITLELEVLKARLSESEAALAMAKRKQERNRDLYRKKLTSADQYEDSVSGFNVAQARRNSDKAQVNRLEDQVRRMTIRAPQDGEIVSESLEQGQWVSPAGKLYEIYSYDRFEILLGLPGRHVMSVPGSGKVQVGFPEIGRGLAGEILGVSRNVDSATGNFSLRVGIDNPEGLLLSGLMARVAVPLGEPVNRLTVPRDAVVRKGSQTQVVAVVQDEAQIRRVELLGSLGDDVLFQGGGLKPGDIVVTRGNEALRPGMKVKIKDASPNGRQ